MTKRWEFTTHAGVWDLDDTVEGGRDQWDNPIPLCVRVYLNPVWANVPGPDGLQRVLTSPALTGAAAQKAYEDMLFEHQTANQVIALIAATVPDSMRKPVLDEDGDETGDYTLKAKHAPTFDFGDIDRILSCTIPGLDGVTLAKVTAAIKDRYGDAVRVT